MTTAAVAVEGEVCACGGCTNGNDDDCRVITRWDRCTASAERATTSTTSAKKNIRMMLPFFGRFWEEAVKLRRRTGPEDVLADALAMELGYFIAKFVHGSWFIVHRIPAS